MAQKLPQVTMTTIQQLYLGFPKRSTVADERWLENSVSRREPLPWNMLTGKLSGCRERELSLDIKELPDYFLLNLKKKKISLPVHWELTHFPRSCRLVNGLRWPSPLWGLRSTRPKLRAPLIFPSPASFKPDKWYKPHPIITQRDELCPMLANVFHHCPWSRHVLLPTAHTQVPQGPVWWLAIRATTQGCLGCTLCNSIRQHRLWCECHSPGVAQCGLFWFISMRHQGTLWKYDTYTRPTDTTIYYMNTCSSRAEICKAVDLFRFGGPVL